jgi:hypothetical protein
MTHNFMVAIAGSTHYTRTHPLIIGIFFTYILQLSFSNFCNIWQTCHHQVMSGPHDFQYAHQQQEIGFMGGGYQQQHQQEPFNNPQQQQARNTQHLSSLST